MSILKLSKEYKKLKSRISKFEKIVELENKILRYFFQSISLNLLIHFSILISLFNSLGFSIFTILIITFSFFIISISLPAFKKLNKAIKIKTKKEILLNESLNVDFKIEDHVDELFEEILELKNARMIEEIDKDIIKDVIELKENKEACNLTNEERVDQFIEYGLKERNYNEIVNE